MAFSLYQTGSCGEFGVILLSWFTRCCLLLFFTFSVLVINPKKLLYKVANPARGLLNREKNMAAPPPHAACTEEIKKSKQTQGAYNKEGKRRDGQKGIA